jgi:hypothetical protein
VSTVADDAFKLAVARHFVDLLDALGYRAQLRTYPDDHAYYQQVGLPKNHSQLDFFGWQADFEAGSAFFEPLVTSSKQPAAPSFPTFPLPDDRRDAT